MGKDVTMKIIKRIISAALAFTLVLQLTACGNKTKKASRKITEDSPWFDANITTVKTGVEESRETALSSIRFVGKDDDYYVIRADGNYKIPDEDEIDWNTFDFNDYQFSIASVADRKTNQIISTIDLKKDLTASEYRVDNVFYLDGKIMAKTSLKERDYDPLTGELLETRDGYNTTDFTQTDIYRTGGYEIKATSFQDKDNHLYSVVQIKAPDGNITTTEFKKLDKDVWVLAVLALSDTKAMMQVEFGNDVVYYELDLPSNKLTEVDKKDYEWIGNATPGNSVAGSDGTVYSKGEYDIYKIDARQKTTEKVFDLSWCGLNRNLLIRMDLIECSEDRFLFFGNYNVASTYEGTDATTINLIELTRASENPHAGKTVLELFSPNGIDVFTGDAVSQFNETNGKYFIEISTRYDIRSYYGEHAFEDDNEDSFSMTRINSTAGLSNELAIDIMSGEGPDILMDVSGYEQLNNPECLVDLTPFVKDLDSEKYFTNIIEGSKTDDAIYQVPVSFMLEGIMTKAENAGSSGKGFTLDEYKVFVDKVMNGNDPILNGQAIYFSMLFASIKEEFIKDGRADLKGPDFEKIAKFVRDNVQENGTSQNDWYNEATLTDDVPHGMYTDYCTGIGGFLSETMCIAAYGKGVVMLGIPSLDGRGPRFRPSCSVAVSAQAVNTDACGEFVNILLSDEIQTRYAMDDSFVVSRDAFRKASSAAMEYYNNGGNSYNGGLSGSTGGLGIEINEQSIGFIEKTILSCSGIKSEDPDISIILIEEMPPYFLGQKDLDAVIKIAENRIQKVLDERG